VSKPYQLFHFIVHVIESANDAGQAICEATIDECRLHFYSNSADDLRFLVPILLEKPFVPMPFIGYASKMMQNRRKAVLRPHLFQVKCTVDRKDLCRCRGRIENARRKQALRLFAGFINGYRNCWSIWLEIQPLWSLLDCNRNGSASSKWKTIFFSADFPPEIASIFQFTSNFSDKIICVRGLTVRQYSQNELSRTIEKSSHDRLSVMRNRCLRFINFLPRGCLHYFIMVLTEHPRLIASPLEAEVRGCMAFQ
jgi:hypothetical protein